MTGFWCAYCLDGHSKRGKHYVPSRRRHCTNLHGVRSQETTFTVSPVTSSKHIPFMFLYIQDAVCYSASVSSTSCMKMRCRCHDRHHVRSERSLKRREMPRYGDPHKGVCTRRKKTRPSVDWKSTTMKIATTKFENVYVTSFSAQSENIYVKSVTT